MILYVNGDSHTAAADAVNRYNFADDDIHYYWMGKVPHPDNLKVSWAQRLSDRLGCHLHCHAQAGCSNDRILRTTTEWINKFMNHPGFKDCLMIIQWSTWERQEWLIDNLYYQVGAFGHDQLPSFLTEQYKKYIETLDWNERAEYWHDRIWDLHLRMQELGIRHVFFNGSTSLSTVYQRKDWQGAYIGPYIEEMAFTNWLSTSGIAEVRPRHKHYGPEGHDLWSDFMFDYLGSIGQ